ncbi:TctA family transporter [Rhizobium sp. BK529]|uniref:hypothetical protein n=1 Tax=unclassified Rhizobium TaxID=2613769 RepID=UPI001042D080|nr:MULTISPECIES: hypothetical protein [unclassified Rhizobium]MBB3592864.1 TctA family transporter [Rhizobium sp. BK529]TCS07245.1 hypothetical protein EV281_102859 [Rhizobium sp. BK418]
MIILTATTLGLTVGLMRSAGAIALVAMFIGLTFALAAIASGGAVSFLALLYTIIGYNAGLLLYLGGLFATDRLRAVLAHS